MQKNTVSLKCTWSIILILSHKSNLSRFKEIEIISSIFSDHNTMRLDIDHREKNNNSKEHKHMEIKQHISK